MLYDLPKQNTLLGGRKEGWMDGWKVAEAGLRIAYSNQKLSITGNRYELSRDEQSSNEQSYWCTWKIYQRFSLNIDALLTTT